MAMLTLLRMTTGEAWNEIMYAAVRSRSIHFQCEQEQTWEQIDKEGIKGCGTPNSQLYFISFYTIGGLMFLNMFMAIILESFGEAEQ